MGALVPQVKGDPVALGDQGLDRGVEVWERLPPGTYPSLRLFGELAARFIDNVEDPLVECLLDEEVDVRLVGLNLSRLRHRRA
jgi:hypothetical protein